MLFGAIAALLGFALPSSLGPVVSDGALTLLLLTILVTPANLYALTHGANFPLDVRLCPAVIKTETARASISRGDYDDTVYSMHARRRWRRRPPDMRCA